MPRNEEYSREFQDIMGRIPSRIIRIGLLVIFGLFVLMISLSYFVRYPDVVKAPVAVVTDSKGGSRVEMYLNPNSLGNIVPGQTAVIKLDAYPYMEYGSLHCKVKSISSSLNSDNRYIVILELPNEIVTSSGKCLKLYSNMTGSGDIVIRNMRLFEKFIQPYLGYRDNGR